MANHGDRHVSPPNVERTEADYYRYNENDSRPFFLNSQHYSEAHNILHELRNSFTSRPHDGPPPPPPDENGGTSDQVSALLIPEENRRLPVDDYFAFYSDLLGFTGEVARRGMDSLPDYFGGGITASCMNPSVQVYLLSDSCMAFTSRQNAADFLNFVTIIVSRWLSNGLIPQCSVGYGSFVERRPFSEHRPHNFFGTQIAGTALSNAASVLKTRDLFGARVLLSSEARQQWPADCATRMVRVKNSYTELLLDRPRTHYLFDCVYYLLCLRDHELDSRPFQHYAWSVASRAHAGRLSVRELAPLVRSAYSGATGSDLRTAIARIENVSERAYGIDNSSSPTSGSSSTAPSPRQR